MSHNKPVVIVGCGNAALCAAISAREAGSEVLVLERAPKDQRGGNTAYTAGAMRVAYRGVQDLKELMPELTEREIATTDFGTYTEDDFYDDLVRVTEYRTDPGLAETLTAESLPTLLWMRDHGVRFNPIYGRQAFKVGDRFTFWGGLVVETWGGGPGLVDSLVAEAERMGIEIRYESEAVRLVRGGAGIEAVEVRRNGTMEVIETDAVKENCENIT